MDLAEEMIKLYGIDMTYIIRNRTSTDNLFGESVSSEFKTAVVVEMYLKNFMGFGGDGDLMSKFGLQVGDTLTMCVGRRRFAQEIGNVYDLQRPNEGDLLYFPYTQGIFEIKFVEHEATFYETGSLQFYELRCQKFNYSGEIFNTGIADIDKISRTYGGGNSAAFRILAENGNWLTDQDGNELQLEDSLQDDPLIGLQNDYFEAQGNTFIDFTEGDPFAEGTIT